MNESKKNKLSHSSISKYLQCPKLYENHYVNRLRGKTISGALLIGSAIDKSINNLLETKSLESAIKVFDSEWEFGYINDKKVHLPSSELIVYAKKDLDLELLIQKDYERFKDFDKEIWVKNAPYENIQELLVTEYAYIHRLKEEKGFENLSSGMKQEYNLVNWMCLKRKAHIMLKAYYEKVLPQIKSVIAVQKRILVTGKTGDEIECYIDLIVEMNDGKKYVLDNKTSSIDYEQDSASKSQQLIMYYYAINKESKLEEKLDGVGFIVMYKNIQKNRIKICENCGYDGTGGRHKTCDKMIFMGEINEKTERCNGNWKETISPECKIDIILNKVTQPAQNLIIQAFLGANEGIKAKVFPPNVDSCMKYGNKCVYYDKCWNGKDETLITLEKKSD